MLKLYKVSGNSMRPALFAGQYILSEQLSYFFRNPAIGEVVILKSQICGRKLVKRIAVVKNGSYFVVGDNPENSLDSRNFGPVKKEDILARVCYNFNNYEKTS